MVYTALWLNTTKSSRLQLNLTLIHCSLQSPHDNWSDYQMQLQEQSWMAWSLHFTCTLCIQVKNEKLIINQPTAAHSVPVCHFSEIVLLQWATWNPAACKLLNDCALLVQAFKCVSHLERKHSSPTFKTPRLTWISAKIQTTGQTPRCQSLSLDCPLHPAPSILWSVKVTLWASRWQTLLVSYKKKQIQIKPDLYQAVSYKYGYPQRRTVFTASLI